MPHLLHQALGCYHTPLFPEPKRHVAAARQLCRRYGAWVADVIRSGDRDGFAPLFSALRDLEQFAGQAYTVAVSTTVYGNQVRALASVAGKTMGLVSAETLIPPGQYRLRLTRNSAGTVYGRSVKGDKMQPPPG